MRRVMGTMDTKNSSSIKLLTKHLLQLRHHGKSRWNQKLKTADEQSPNGAMLARDRGR